jgi:hypothetical protein
MLSPRWVLPLTLALLAGCQNSVQTSSGAAYRAARPALDARDVSAIDRAVDQAANVEPLLRFPARIGLARILNGRIVPVPPREADAWIDLAKAHADLGSFVPISPLIAEMVRSGAGNAATVIDGVRLGAARQHVDAVLIYTVGASGDDAGSPLSLLDLTIIGAYLVPSRSVKGDAAASALLLDVRNGYPYGTANAVASASDFVPSVGSGRQGALVREDAEIAAVGKLAAQVDIMMGKLQTDLQTKEIADLRAQQASSVPSARSARPMRAAKGAAL